MEKDLKSALNDSRFMQTLICKMYCANNGTPACKDCGLVNPIKFRLGEEHEELIKEGFLPSGRNLVTRYMSDLTCILENLFGLTAAVGDSPSSDGDIANSQLALRVEDEA